MQRRAVKCLLRFTLSLTILLWQHSHYAFYSYIHRVLYCYNSKHRHSPRLLLDRRSTVWKVNDLAVQNHFFPLTQVTHTLLVTALSLTWLLWISRQSWEYWVWHRNAVWLCQSITEHHALPLMNIYRQFHLSVVFLKVGNCRIPYTEHLYNMLTLKVGKSKSDLGTVQSIQRCITEAWIACQMEMTAHSYLQCILWCHLEDQPTQPAKRVKQSILKGHSDTSLFKN